MIGPYYRHLADFLYERLDGRLVEYIREVRHPSRILRGCGSKEKGRGRRTSWERSREGNSGAGENASDNTKRKE